MLLAERLMHAATRNTLCYIRGTHSHTPLTIQPLLSCRGNASSHGTLCRTHFMCEWIQCGRTVKARLEPTTRKKRQEKGRKGKKERESASEHVVAWS